MIGRLHHVIVDCPDPAALAAFYAGLTGLPVTYHSDDFVVIARDDTTSGVAFQRAPDHQPPRWPDPDRPQQFHLDIMVDDVDEAEPLVLELGARRLPTADQSHVYADPAGHPFCLIPRPAWAPPIRALPAPVHRSVSTWQQPLPAQSSAERQLLTERVARRILARGGGRLRVGIDGLTAAGKTSFGHELAARISSAGRPVLRASLDDFKKPWRDRHLYDRESGEGYYRNAFDYPTLTKLLLEPAGKNGSGRCVLCAIDPLTQVDHSTVVTAAATDAVLIVDGVFAFRPEINEHWDFRIWLDIDPELSVRRGTHRDQDWAGAEAEALHRDRYLVGERLYLSEVDPLRLVDVVVDNSNFDQPRITVER